MSAPALYRKRPITVRAMQWTGANLREVEQHFPALRWRVDSRPGDGLIVTTLEGELVASPGDWLIEGVRGEYYPCKPDVFATTYDLVERDMITARDLDCALHAGTLRVGIQRNAVPVKCALCHTDCSKGQAVKVYLSARGWRSVYLCRAACAPKPEKAL